MPPHRLDSCEWHKKRPSIITHLLQKAKPSIMRPIDATARAIIVISTPLILFFLMNSDWSGVGAAGQRELIPRESLAFCYLITKRPYRDGAAKLKA